MPAARPTPTAPTRRPGYSITDAGFAALDRPTRTPSPAFQQLVTDRDTWRTLAYAFASAVYDQPEVDEGLRVRCSHPCLTGCDLEGSGHAVRRAVGGSNGVRYG
jgi:hypothetical protein